MLSASRRFGSGPGTAVLTRASEHERLDALFASASAAVASSQRDVRRLDVAIGDLASSLGLERPDEAEIAPGGGAVLIVPTAANRKLSPVDLVRVKRANGEWFERKRPVPRAPFVSSTYVPVAQTCPPCPFKGNGCMAESGYTGRAVRRLEEAAAGLDALEVLRLEAFAIDKLFRAGVPRDGGRDGRSPRDMRLHVSGDVTTRAGLRGLVDAVWRWKRRGGGSAWTFTHAWRRLPGEDWGTISVLASVEKPADADVARSRGYAPAITVRSFPLERAFRLEGSTTTWIPCPAELGRTTCVECRLCLDRADWLRETNRGIAFAVHGQSAEKARRRLPVVRSVG